MIITSPKNFEQLVINYIKQNDRKWAEIWSHSEAIMGWDTMVRHELKKHFGSHFDYTYMGLRDFEINVNGSIIRDHVPNGILMIGVNGEGGYLKINR